MLVIAALWVGNGGSKSIVKRSPAIESHAWDNQLADTRPKCDCGCGWKEILEAKKDTRGKNYVVHLNCDNCSLGDESELWFCKDGQTAIKFSGDLGNNVKNTTGVGVKITKVTNVAKPLFKNQTYYLMDIETETNFKF